LKRPAARAVSGAHLEGLVGNAGKLSPPDQHVWGHCGQQASAAPAPTYR